MTKHECQMTNEVRMKTENPKALARCHNVDSAESNQTRIAATISRFEIRHSFVIRHSSFVIFTALGIWCFTRPALAYDPQIDAWFTTYSGKYARIYATDADKASGNAVATWSRNSISQTIPARCGVYFVGSSANWVYIRSTGLASHIMGPWYLNAAHTMLFPNVPK